MQCTTIHTVTPTGIGNGNRLYHFFCEKTLQCVTMYIATTVTSKGITKKL